MKLHPLLLLSSFLPLVCVHRALIGASMFISTVVLGTIILITRVDNISESVCVLVSLSACTMYRSKLAPDPGNGRTGGVARM